MRLARDFSEGFRIILINIIEFTLQINIQPVRFSSQLMANTSTSDALAIIKLMAQKPWSMWLDSCNSEHVDNRFDIFVWQPVSQVMSKHGQTIVKQNDHEDVTTRDPLTAVEQQINQCFSDADITKSPLPFSGGAVGYFSYDLGRQFEKLPTAAHNDLDIYDMAVGIYDQAIIIDKRQNQVYLFCEDSKRNALTKQLISQAKAPLSLTPFMLTSDWHANMTKAEYIEKFEKIQDFLLSGDCYQINLTQRFNAHYVGDEFNAYLSLREHNNAPFSAFINLEELSVLSISPERFVQVKENKVQTKPIKGTRPRSKDQAIDQANKTDLLNATKDKAENLMIVDLLRNDLSKACRAGSVQVPKLFDIESFPAVHHLVSTVEGDLAADKSSVDLLRGAFPGGSITGAPKIRAMEIIEALEPHRRNIYCGSIGYISACGNMDTSITIRTLTCYNNHIYCSAGGGIVADSKADDEYQETFDKVNKILPILSQLTNDK